MTSTKHSTYLNLRQKVISQTSLANLGQQAKQEKRRVVWTNGCFDLLHFGHVHYLEAARNLGDILVVGINSDNSVANLKGQNRPIVPLEGRMHVVAALAAVDFVVAFSDPTPINLILALQPAIIAKGGDYHADDVVGKHEAKSWGGEVKILAFEGDWSTTKLLEKILQIHSPAKQQTR